MVRFTATNTLRHAGSGMNAKLTAWLTQPRTGPGVHGMICGKAWGDNQEGFEEVEERKQMKNCKVAR